jgi:hypothetical protein
MGKLRVNILFFSLLDNFKFALCTHKGIEFHRQFQETITVKSMALPAKNAQVKCWKMSIPGTSSVTK